jgi:hypothetical protein
MNYTEADYEMHLEFLRREIIRDLAETARYKEQLKQISISCSNIPAELRPTPLRRENRESYYAKQYKPNSVVK